MGRSGVYRIHTLADMTSGTALLPYTAADTSRIYALSSDKVFSVPVQECDTVSTCGECSELADPHCGWCSLSNKYVLSVLAYLYGWLSLTLPTPTLVVVGLGLNMESFVAVRG